MRDPQEPEHLRLVNIPSLRCDLDSELIAFRFVVKPGGKVRIILQKVEKLKNCSREGNTYTIKKESPDEWAGYIKLYPEENRATLEYTFRDALF